MNSWTGERRGWGGLFDETTISYKSTQKNLLREKTSKSCQNMHRQFKLLIKIRFQLDCEEATQIQLKTSSTKLVK